MDFGAIGESLPIIILIVVLVVAMFLLRRPKPEVTEREIVLSLLSEVRLNKVLVETFHLRQEPKRFETVSWLRNKNKLAFLSQSLQNAMSEVFGMAEEFNKQLAVAKRHKSTGYLAGINGDKMKEMLEKSQKGLEEWLLAHGGMPDSSLKYPNLFDTLFGRR